jgi:hypothetical protein
MSANMLRVPVDALEKCEECVSTSLVVLRRLNEFGEAE